MTRGLSEQTDTLARAQQMRTKLADLRRQIHAHPELSFEERATAQLVASFLKEIGYRVKTGIGGTGVIAEIGSGRTVIVRADMDALPIEELNETGYRSLNSGVMHACGHDAHTACALGAAMLLAARPPRKGCVRFLFQPAEETVNADGKSGATLMIEEGATESAEAVFALHVDPRLKTGHVGIRAGALLAACASFDITIRGVASHGAYPQFGVDGIVLASHVVQALQQVISRRKSALDPAVLTLGGIKSSTYRPNILAEEVQLTGTVRYFGRHMNELLYDEIKKACTVAEALGGSFELRYSYDTPALYNDPQLTNLVKLVGSRLLGADCVEDYAPEMGADDFSFLTDHMPGCYFVLGTMRDGDLRKIHTSTFDINEDSLPIGAAMLAECARTFLGG